MKITTKKCEEKYYEMYHEGIDISAGYSSVPDPKFNIGDWVRTTAVLHVRTGAGLSYPDACDRMPLHTIGQITGGLVEADGFVWWGVLYGENTQVLHTKRTKERA